MADSKDKPKAEKPSKEVAKAGDDVFNVIKLVSKADPPNIPVKTQTKN